MTTDYTNPKLLADTSKNTSGEFTWRSPSNIAIIKYWGKYGRQLPRNPSISFTLENAFTDTRLEYGPKEATEKNIDLDFFFHDEPNPAFQIKLVKFLESVSDIFPFLRQFKFTIRSGNSFPHSAGIASSASAMSALALCLCSMEDEIFQTLQNDVEFDKKASFVSRLGSGSACRSVYGGLALWGKTGEVENSSDLYAVPYADETHEIFKTFHDDILLVSTGEKSVSSTAGHGLMEDNIYAAPRFQQAGQRMHNLLEALKTGDVETFGNIAENEALTLHAMMMASNPSYMLMEPNTIEIIKRVRAYRAETKEPLYFSLDAGPNIHLLYPEEIIHNVSPFVESELLPLCQDGKMIQDWIGEGPQQV